jgi:hypothetical protein
MAFGFHIRNPVRHFLSETPHSAMTAALFAWALIQTAFSACTISSFSGNQSAIRSSGGDICFRLQYCQFLDLYPKGSSQQGGAIFISLNQGGIGSLEINSTLFYRCEIHPNGGNAEGGAIWASCRLVSTFRTCFDNCASMYSGHALYLATRSINDERVHTFCTFTACGFARDTNSNTEGAGTLYMSYGTSNVAATLTVEHTNFTGNRALDGPGSVWHANANAINPRFRWVMCNKNAGFSEIHYVDSYTWPTGRSPLLFEYVNFIDADATGYNAEACVIRLTNAEAQFSYCVFRNANLNLMVVGATQCWVSNCVANRGFPAAVTLANLSSGTTATYDPGVPVSVCMATPGTQVFSLTHAPTRSAAFAGSAGWSATSGLTESAAIVPSSQHRASNSFFASELAVSGPIAASHEASASAGFEASAQIGESAAVGETGRLVQSQGIPGTGRFGETGALERTGTHVPSQEFSASSPFTDMDRPNRQGSLVELSGYLFFVFFYGDM